MKKHIPVKKTVKTSGGVIWVYPLFKVYSSLYNTDKVILDRSLFKQSVHIVRRDIVIGKPAFKNFYCIQEIFFRKNKRLRGQLGYFKRINPPQLDPYFSLDSSNPVIYMLFTEFITCVDNCRSIQCHFECFWAHLSHNLFHNSIKD